jgi:hypothetical protein
MIRTDRFLSSKKAGFTGAVSRLITNWDSIVPITQVFCVIPAKAGIHCCQSYEFGKRRIPAFSGMTGNWKKLYTA